MIPLPKAFLNTPLAHRALHGAGRPENALSAVHAAVAAGYGIEVDVQPSSDGRAMIFHDETLDRLTEERGPIAARPASELTEIALKGGDGEGIPTLAAVLTAVSGRVPLLIEIKDQDGALGENLGDLEAMVANDLKGYDGPVAVMSFNPHAVHAMAKFAPDVPRGLVTCDFNHTDWPDVAEADREPLRAMHMLDDVRASFISHDQSDLASPYVARAKASGRDVLCWTIRSAVIEAEARKYAANVTFEGYLP